MIGKAGFVYFAIIASFSLTRLVFAEETNFGHITILQTNGSLSDGGAAVASSGKTVSEDSITVTLDVPFVNSREQTLGQLPNTGTPCKLTAGGYALDPVDPGIKVNESVILSAYLAGRRVRLDLNGCVYNKPRIISITMSTSEN